MWKQIHVVNVAYPKEEFIYIYDYRFAYRFFRMPSEWK